MTAQISDSVEYEGRIYNVCGVSSTGLFDPRDHDIEVEPPSTACYRGFFCSYQVVDGELRISKICLSLSQLDKRRTQIKKGVSILGHRVTKIPEPAVGANHGVENLSESVDYTGGMLLGESFIRDLYVHMGFHPAWKYRNVVELYFTKGKLTATNDRSEEMAHLRTQISANELRPDHDRCSHEEILKWIDDCFDQTYTPTG